MIMSAFSKVTTIAYDVLNITITVDTFTFTLWQVLLVSIVISITAYFVRGMME